MQSQRKNTGMSLQDKLRSLLCPGNVHSPMTTNIYSYNTEDISREFTSFQETWIDVIIPSVIGLLKETLSKSFDYSIKNVVDLIIYIKPTKDTYAEKIVDPGYEPVGVITVEPITGEKEQIYSKIIIQVGYNKNKSGNSRTLNWKLGKIFDKDEYIKNIVNNIISFGKNLGILNEGKIGDLLKPMSKTEIDKLDDELNEKIYQDAERIYQDALKNYKIWWNKALKEHPDYNKIEIESKYATDDILNNIIKIYKKQLIYPGNYSYKDEVIDIIHDKILDGLL